MSEENKKEKDQDQEVENNTSEVNAEEVTKDESADNSVEPKVEAVEVGIEEPTQEMTEESTPQEKQEERVAEEPTSAQAKDKKAKAVKEEDVPSDNAEEMVSAADSKDSASEDVTSDAEPHTEQVENQTPDEAKEEIETPSEVDAASEESTDAEESESTEDSEEEEVEEIDYSEHSREALVEVVEQVLKDEKFAKADRILNQIVPLFHKMEKDIKEAALNKFIIDGGATDDFSFNHDEFFNRFDGAVKVIKDRRSRMFKEREANKEKNYEKKVALLDRLRELVDGDEATTNLAPIKEIQQEWRSIGPVPHQHNRTLWANYNALLDRFYDHRNILFELKELDRKKNQVAKEKLCEEAEKLSELEDVKQAIVQLNEMHEKYKAIGAVPREVQESLWQRFKAASDEVYKKRKVYLDELKGELHENLEKKKALIEEIKVFLTFDSDRINEWNAKTKEVVAIQKKWEALGGLPREHAKEVNKAFWSSFKGFFSNKNEFFKKLEGKRKENLEAKQKLVEEAKALKDSQEFDKTADKMKALQRKWKELGPVPEKFRNSIYAEFKEACDEFFNNRRALHDKEEEGYADNLKKKEELCAQIEAKAKAKDGAAKDLDDFITQWKEIGFVPKASIREIDAKFKEALSNFVSSLDVPEEDREGLVMKAELSSLGKGPNANKNLQKKEGTIRRQIQELEDNINLWNNNLAFFANSKTADKLKKEFDEKIEKAQAEVLKLKKQLRMVRSI